MCSKELNLHWPFSQMVHPIWRLYRQISATRTHRIWKTADRSGRTWPDGGGGEGARPRTVAAFFLGPFDCDFAHAPEEALFLQPVTVTGGRTTSLEEGGAAAGTPPYAR